MENYEKKYKSLVKAVKTLKEANQSDEGIQNWVEDNVPELQKSEDERIRKAIYIYLDWLEGRKDYAPKGKYSIRDMLAWLEKQGEKSITIDVDKMVLKYSQTMDGDFGLPVECQIRAYRQGINDTLRLERQGHQEEPQVYETENGEVITYSESEGYKVVEPKFKVGDWIITEDKNVHEDYRICRICKIENGRYYIENGDFFYKESFDNYEYRLWTIQDAKDGDVLSYRDSQWILIYKKQVDDNSFHYYSLYSTIHQDLTIDDSAFTVLIDKVVPATKEQYDLLFSKMKEAGYTFDFEKKELKKIENEIEIPFGAKDSELQEATYYIPKGFYSVLDGNKVIIKRFKNPRPQNN